MNFSIVKAHHSDVDFIVRLHKKYLYASSWSWDQKYLRDVLSTYYILKANDRLIGAVGVSSCSWDHSFDIETLAILRRYQTKGFGRKVIEFVKKMAWRENAVKITVGSYNTFRAIGFYKKLGFVVVNKGDDGDGLYTDLEYRVDANMANSN